MHVCSHNCRLYTGIPLIHIWLECIKKQVSHEMNKCIYVQVKASLEPTKKHAMKMKEGGK